MATLTVNVPDALVPRLVPALVDRFPELAGGTNGQIGKGGVRALLREVLAQYEARVAELAAYAAMLAAAEAAKVAAQTDADAIA